MRDEMRFDADPFRWQASPQKLSTDEVGRSDESVYHPLPRLQTPMNRQHQRDGRGGWLGAAVTGGSYATPKAVVNTLFAHPALTKKGPCGTEQPKVVQCLNDRDADLPAGVISGWRDKGKGVVEMCDIGTLLTQDRPQFRDSVTGPNRPKSQLRGCE